MAAAAVRVLTPGQQEMLANAIAPTRHRLESHPWTEFGVCVALARGATKQYACKFCRAAREEDAEDAEQVWKDFWRLLTHVKICSHAGVEDTSRAQALMADKSAKRAHDQRTRARQLDEAGRGLKRQPTITQALDSSVKDLIDDAVGRFIFAENLPLRIGSSPEFRELIERVMGHGSQLQALSYRPPHRAKLASTVLDRVYQSAWPKIVDNFERCRIGNATSMVLGVDGWTSVDKRNWMHFVAYGADGEIVPIRLRNTTTDEHSGEGEAVIIAEEIDSLCTNLREHTGNSNLFPFGGIITDAAPAVVSAGRSVVERFPQMLHLTCAAHRVSLVLKDVATTNVYLRDAIEFSNDVSKFVRNHAKIKGVFCQFMSEARSKAENLLMPALTRFGTTFLQMERVLECRNAITQTMLDERVLAWRSSRSITRAIAAKAQRVSSAVARQEEWEAIVVSLSLTAPVMRLLRAFDRDGTTLGKVLYRFNRAMQEVEHVRDELKAAMAEPAGMEQLAMDIIGNLTWRVNEHMSITPAYRFAFCVDPEFREFDHFKCDAVQRDFVQFVRKYASGEDFQLTLARAIAELKRFKSTPQLQQVVAEGVDGCTVWQLPLLHEMCPVLAPLALQVLSMPCSTSAVERSLSDVGQVLRDQRSSLGDERAEKLLQTMTHLRSLREPPSSAWPKRPLEQTVFNSTLAIDLSAAQLSGATKEARQMWVAQATLHNQQAACDDDDDMYDVSAADLAEASSMLERVQAMDTASREREQRLAAKAANRKKRKQEVDNVAGAQAEDEVDKVAGASKTTTTRSKRSCRR